MYHWVLHFTHPSTPCAPPAGMHRLSAIHQYSLQQAFQAGTHQDQSLRNLLQGNDPGWTRMCNIQIRWVIYSIRWLRNTSTVSNIFNMSIHMQGQTISTMGEVQCTVDNMEAGLGIHLILGHTKILETRRESKMGLFQMGRHRGILQIECRVVSIWCK